MAAMGSTAAPLTDGLLLPPVAVWGNLVIYCVFWLLLMWPQHLPLGRPSIAVVFAALACGLRAACHAAWPDEDLPTVDIYSKVNPTPITLLFGLMLVNAYVKDTGLWEHVEGLLKSDSPLHFFVKLCGASALMSAILLNDTVCFVLTPIVLRLCRRQRAVSTLPYLIALSTSSNIGSCLTVIGNPQNALIASIYPDITFLGFTQVMLAPVLLGLVLNTAALVLWFRRDLRFNDDDVQADDTVSDPSAADVECASVATARKAGFAWTIYVTAVLSVVSAMLVGWFFGLATGDVALASGAALMFVRAVRRRLAGSGSMSTETDFGLGAVDYSILILFIGQFILVGATVDTGLPQKVFRFVLGPCASDPSSTPGCVFWFSGLVLSLSNLIGNVPVILMLQPLLASLPSTSAAGIWLLCAWVATASGNLTMLGSAANLIVAHTAESQGEQSFTSTAFAKSCMLPTLVVTSAGALLMPVLCARSVALGTAAVLACGLLLLAAVGSGAWRRCRSGAAVSGPEVPPADGAESRSPPSASIVWPSREAVGLFVLSVLSAAEGLGPFQGAWLTANPVRSYSPSELGMLGGVAQALMTVLTPVLGKLVDRSLHKRLLLGLGSACIGASVAITVFAPGQVWLQVLIQVPMCLGQALVPVALGALTLGTVPLESFTRQVALNSAGTHVGTVVSSSIMALCALYGPKVKFVKDGVVTEVTSPVWSIVPLLMAALAVSMLWLVRGSRIDHQRAAGCSKDAEERADADEASTVGLFSRTAFYQVLFLAFTFNFANMAQLQLLVQHAAELLPNVAIPYTCAAQLIAHIGMTGSSFVAGRFADSCGRKGLLVFSCAVVTLRAALTALTEHYWIARGGSPWLGLLPCQLLDGVGAGLWAVLLVLVVQDVSAGTGCFNLAFGCTQAAFSAGAVASSLTAGALAESKGFGAAFVLLGAVGLAATVQAAVFPETRVAQQPQVCSRSTSKGASQDEAPVDLPPWAGVVGGC